MNIVFTHNVQNRHQTLMETIKTESTLFPNANIVVAYNDKNFNLDFFNDVSNIEFIYFVGEGHKVGCVNGCITAINNSLKYNSDVIIFSHDDVKINNGKINIFQQNVEDIYSNKSDIICRQPEWINNYLMMEGFFINKESARKMFEVEILHETEKTLPVDDRQSPSPEVWLDDLVKKCGIKSKIVKYNNADDYNGILGENLGFYHKNAGIRGWKD